jgi:hypothetical protein
LFGGYFLEIDKRVGGKLGKNELGYLFLFLMDLVHGLNEINMEKIRRKVRLKI